MDEKQLIRYTEVVLPKCTTLVDVTREIEEIVNPPKLEIMFSPEEKRKLKEVLFHISLAYSPEKTSEQWKSSLDNYIVSNGYENKEILSPLRIALSHKQHSYSPFDLLYCLPIKESVTRIYQAIDQ